MSDTTGHKWGRWRLDDKRPGKAVQECNRCGITSPVGREPSHEHDGWPRRSGAFLQWSWDSRAVDQGGEVRAELDSAVVPSVRGQPGASVSVHSGVQPWELPSPVMPAQGGQALVAAECAGQADQDGRPSGAALPAIDLSVIRDNKTMQESSRSHTRTSSMPVLINIEKREVGSAASASLLPYSRILPSISFGLPFEPEDSQYGKSWVTYAECGIDAEPRHRPEAE